MSRKAYPGYKPSGVEWLGEVPEHWDTLECKFGYSIQLGKMLQNGSQTPNDEQVPYLKALYVQWENINISDLPEMWASPGDILKYSVRDGDLLVCEGGEVGRAGILRNPPARCIIQNALHHVRPKGGNSNRFLMYLLKVASFQGWFDILCNKATIAHFTGEKFGSLSVTLPTPHEQRAIAAFLDRETGRIDALMEKKQRQIELLQEKRAALISHAVTKGLDPTAPLKDSGVEWLGEIPEHWEILRLKFLIEFVTSGSRGWAQYYSDEGAIFLRIGNLSRVSLNLNLSDVQFVEPPAGAEVERTRVKKDDVLISITAYVGSVSVIEEDIGEAYVNQHIALTRPLPGKVEPKWLGYVLLSEIGQHQFRIQLYGGTKEGFGLDDVKDLSILLPPPFEQKTIVSFLNQETRKIDTLINRIRDSIDRLKEYRTALISAAVTGKIDVCGEVGIAQTQRRAPAAFQRVVIAAEIVNRLYDDPNFGRVKLQKVLYLCEHHLGMDLQGNYWRQAAGPLDNQMLYSVEKQIERQKWFAIRRDGPRIMYVPMEKAGGHRKYFDDYWADYREGLDSLLDVMRPLNTKRCEIVATLFAAWNDLIIAGVSFNDADILHEVRSNWHESKERLDEDRLRRALQWMRGKGLIPRGLGRATRT